MIRKIPALLTLTLASPFALAAEGDAAPQQFVRIDGTTINQHHFAAFSSEHGGAQAGTAEGRVNLLNQLVNMTILAKAAREEGLTDDPQVSAALEVAEITVLAQAALRNAFNENPITEDEIQQTFEQLYSNEPRTEFKARHILVEEEDKAKALIEELTGGADFAELAREHSTGPSGAQGGELGWFEPDQMVAPFSAAVAELDKGAFTREPVQTQFGWHVILLEDRREAPPVKLDSVRQEIVGQLQRERATSYMQQAREKVEVEILAPQQAQ
jgi:peptidyl-prolyl cis-trans isomerase C